MIQNAALPDPLPTPPPEPIPMPEGGGDRNSNPLYAFPNARVVYHFLPTMPLRVSAMRSLGAYHNIFAIESFMDELAEAAGADPVAFRLRHMKDARARDVIAGRGRTLRLVQAAAAEAGHGRGFAFARYKNLGAYCAIALDLTVEHETGRVRIGRVVAAVDSGQPINPDGIRNQIEGAIVQSASWTLYEAGHVRSPPHHQHGLERLSHPALPGGAGERRRPYHRAPRPAVSRHGRGGTRADRGGIANALRNATGVRLRDLPLSQDRVKAAIGV